MIRRAAVLAVLVLAFAASGPVRASDEIEEGRKVFNQCKACHTVEKGGRNSVGPNLHGLFGRRAGAVEDFKYSEPMRESGIVWDDSSVARYVSDPKTFVPGNKMAFAGIRREKLVADLLAYLREATK